MASSFIISLDFELHWGVRDKKTVGGPYRRNLMGARTAIPFMLKLFEMYGAKATWSTVGMLFAESKEEWLAYAPERKPNYTNSKLDAYQEVIGKNEKEDPLHFAHSIIKRISETAGQEISTHTWSHYYCLEAGQTKEDFRADVDAAVRIATDKGYKLESIVFPRNQYNPDYDDVLLYHGINVIRRNPSHPFYREDDGDGSTELWKRGGRLADAYVPVSGYQNGKTEKLSSELISTVGSRFLRPYSQKLRKLENLRLHRIKSEMKKAAKSGMDYHLWWHPHNFGTNTEENLYILERILEHFKVLEKEYGMESKGMAQLR